MESLAVQSFCLHTSYVGLRANLALLGFSYCRVSAGSKCFLLVRNANNLVSLIELLANSSLELRLKIYGYLLSEWPYACFTGTVPVVYDPEYRRWPAILRTNHQIYLEACTVLYTEVTAVLLTSDILCLGRTIPQGFHAPRIQLWAHHPFLDPIGHYYNRFGQRISNALRPKQLALQSRFGIRFNKCPIETCTLQPVHYDCPPLNGSLEPHVFTRFQNLYFQLHLDLEMIACPYRIDGNRKIQPIGGNNFTSFLRGCSLFENIVQLVSKVPYVQQLTISIEMKSAPLLIMEYGLAGYTERNFTKLYFDIHSKACEELVDSGVLDKFLRLSNVKKFDVVFVRAGVDPMQDKNVRDLERAVEQQWASRPVPELNGF